MELASAGFGGEGTAPPQEMIDVLSRRAIDISAHRSRALTDSLVQAADLVATMTRQHLVDLLPLAGDAWTRCFTLTDLVRRGEAVGARRRNEDLLAWVRRAHAGRTRSDVLSLSLADDIGDPLRGRPSDYERVADQIEALIDRLHALLWPPSEQSPTSRSQAGNRPSVGAISRSRSPARPFPQVQPGKGVISRTGPDRSLVKARGA